MKNQNINEIIYRVRWIQKQIYCAEEKDIESYVEMLTRIVIKMHDSESARKMKEQIVKYYRHEIDSSALDKYIDQFIKGLKQEAAEKGQPINEFSNFEDIANQVKKTCRDVEKKLKRKLRKWLMSDDNQ